MKTNILVNIMLLLASLGNLQAQIGINTENPLGTFHIDGKGDTNAAGANISDDVIFSSENNRVKVGIGIKPSAGSKAAVHISTTPTGPSALKLVDGSQRQGQVLGTKDADGTIGWLTPPTSWAKVFNITGAKRNFPNNVQNLFFSTQIPETGRYLVTIRWWGMADINYGASPARIISAYFFLNEGTSASSGGTNSQKDAVEYYQPYWNSNTPFTFMTFLQGNFTAGRWLKIYITPATPIGNKYNWIIGTYGGRELNPSVLLFKI